MSERSVTIERVANGYVVITPATIGMGHRRLIAETMVDYPIKLCGACERKLGWYLEHEAPVTFDANAPELAVRPEPRGCPTPGACSAVAANSYLPMVCPRCGRRRLEASIATDGRRPFVSAIVCEKCGLVGSDEESEPALCASTEVFAGAAEWMREECAKAAENCNCAAINRDWQNAQQAIAEAIRALPTEREDDDG